MSAAPRFISALSVDEDTDAAIESCAATVTAELGAEPDLLFAFATPHHASTWGTLGRRLRAATGAGTLVGCSGAGLVGRGREIEDGRALSVLAVRAPAAEVRAVAMQARREGDGFRIVPELGVGNGTGVVLLVDPFTFPLQPYLPHLGEHMRGRPVVGGMASGGTNAGEHVLWLDDDAHDSGAVALVIGGGLELRAAVSQGCRPVGKPLVVTSCKGNVILKLRGKPATKVLIEILESMPDRDRELFRNGPHVGLAMDATKSSFAAADLVVRNVLGLLPKEDGIAIGDDSLRAGMSVQFMLRDATSASEELSTVLAARAGEWAEGGTQDAGALLFTCGGRGTNLFRTPDHDAKALEEHLGPDLPVAGFFANGEIGSVGGQPFLHGFTASVGYLS